MNLPARFLRASRRSRGGLAADFFMSRAHRWSSEFGRSTFTRANLLSSVFGFKRNHVPHTTKPAGPVDVEALAVTEAAWGQGALPLCGVSLLMYGSVYATTGINCPATAKSSVRCRSPCCYSETGPALRIRCH